MNLDEDTRTHYIKVGKMTMEQVALDGEEYLPKVVAEVGGEMHLFGVPGFDEFRAVQREILKMGKPCTGLVFTVDSYLLNPSYGYGLGGKVIESFIPGTLGDRFRAGDRRVFESLQITGMTLTEGFLAMVAYRRDGSTLLWDEPTVLNYASEAELGGRYPEVMRQIISQSQRFN